MSTETFPSDSKKPASAVIDIDSPKSPSSSGRTSLSEDIGDPSLVDGDYGSQGGHVFEDEKMCAYWYDIYKNANYESLHRFDPKFKWSAKEEKKVLRKVDLRVMTWTWLMFVSLDLNRRSANRAITDSFLGDLGMTTNDFNTGQTIFLLSFLFAELPSGLLSKWLGPDRWIPFIACAWSGVSLAQAGLTSKPQYFALRCILGLVMGGFIPDAVLYLTYWYKTSELPIRLSWFWTGLMFCAITGALFAAGILEMRGMCGLAGWRWLFIVEGSVTFVIGLLSWGLMPPGPCQTANWFRGKDGWFNEREEKILTNRLLRDDPSKGDMNNRQAVTLKLLWKSLKDYDMWPIYLLGVTCYIPPKPVESYLAYQLKLLGFSTLHANLLTIPAQVCFALQLLLITKATEWFREKSILSSLSNVWFFPFLIALLTLKDTSSYWLRYALTSSLLAYPYCHAVLAGWTSRNSNSVRTRAVSGALYNMTVQGGSIIASQIYREDDKPLYKRGNKILLGVCIWNILLFWAVKGYYMKRNANREKAWSQMSEQEKETYKRETTDEGNKRLDFRFAH